jgi:lipoate-protein ligase A
MWKKKSEQLFFQQFKIRRQKRFFSNISNFPMQIIQPTEMDIHRNLAVEEWLLDHAAERGPILFLCVNSPCVVIGKNQNPWRECRLSLMEKEGVPLARRISGGGAVYHDEGNLNVSIIVSRTEYREEKQYELIFQCLDKFGINASKVRKNSLVVDELKFSGQAFCFRGQHVLHHGTLLVNADLKRLGRYLGPEVEGIQTKAVASVPAKVANLSQFASGLTVETLSAALIEEFQILYAPGEVTRPTTVCSSTVGRVTSPGEISIPEEELPPIIGRNSSKDWNLGHTPRFQVALNGQTLEVEKGRIINFDSMPLFEEWLKGNQG